MTTKTYIVGRKQYQRPQGLLFSDNQGTTTDEVIIPYGNEFEDFIVLTDDNRQPIQMSTERIEQRKRMINGRMRSIHIADKLKLSVSWDMIPSRAFNIPGATAVDPTTAEMTSARYTTDGGAGGADIYKWYSDHPGPFWVYLAYDNYYRFSNQPDPWSYLNQYNERVEMYFADFSYEIVKRGPLFDFWNVSLSLEEV